MAMARVIRPCRLPLVFSCVGKGLGSGVALAVALETGGVRVKVLAGVKSRVGLGVKLGLEVAEGV